MTKPVIYRIRNIIDGKFYVGSTINQRERFRTHRNKLRRGVHHTPHLQNAWRKYGEEAFVFEVVEVVPSVAELQGAEDRWLVAYVGTSNCYNAGLRSGAPWRGIRTEDHPCYGRPKSDEEKARIAAGVCRKYAEDPTYQPRVGRAHSEESRQAISRKVRRATAEGRGGRFIPSEETRARMAAALKGNQNAKGHVRTEEHRRKLSEANAGNQNWLGRKHTTESKAKMAKQIMELTESRVFCSLTEALEYYQLKMPTLRRALKTGNPIQKGPHKGRMFRYLDVPCG